MHLDLPINEYIYDFILEEMVFKSIIRYIINRYLKKYIEELNDDKLNFDLRNGFIFYYLFKSKFFFTLL